MMKNISKIMTRGFIVLAFLGTMIITACSDSEDHKSVTPEGNSNTDIKNYSPISGGFGTDLSFYGSNLPTDLDRIKVTVNGTDAEVKSSNGRIIVAAVSKDSGSGTVILYIDGEPRIMDVQFSYGYQLIVSSPLANGKGNIDGSLSEAKIANPRNIIWGKDGEMFVLCGDVTSPSATDYASIRRIQDGMVTTIWKDDYQNSIIQKPRSIAFSKNKNTLYITSDKQGKGTMFFKMERQADNSFGAPIPLLSNVGAPLFLAIAVNPVTDEVFLLCYNKPVGIYKYNPADDTVTPMFDIIPGSSATSAGLTFNQDGTKIYASFAWNGRGIYQADYNTSTGTFSNLSVLAGSGSNTQGYVDAKGTSALFREPMQMDVDAEGNVYVSDCTNHCIRKIAPDGTTTSYAGVGDNSGADKTKGYADGAANVAKFDKPMGCQLAPNGILYVSDLSLIHI